MNVWRRCVACRSHELEPITYKRSVEVDGTVTTFEFLSSRCTSCGAKQTRGKDHDANIQQIRDAGIPRGANWLD